MNTIFEFFKYYLKEEKPEPRFVRPFICHSSKKECIENYKLLTKYYEEIDLDSEEYKNDKYRRINNFLLYGKIELE